MKIYKGVSQFFLFPSPSKIKFQTIILGTIIVSPLTREDPSLSIMNLQIFLSYGLFLLINRNLFLNPRANISAIYRKKYYKWNSSLIIKNIVWKFSIRNNNRENRKSFLALCDGLKKRGGNLTVMGQNVVFQSALQMEPVLADVALEPSHPCVRQLVRLQHGRSLELGWAEVALERRVGRVNDHVRPQAARPEESLLADRALERLHVGVHQLVIAQRLPVEQLLLADSALERPSARVHLGLVHPQLVPLLEFEPAGN